MARDFTLKSDLTKKCKVNVIYNPIETNIRKEKMKIFKKKFKLKLIKIIFYLVPMVAFRILEKVVIC